MSFKQVSIQMFRFFFQKMMFYKALTAACFILTPILLGSLTGFLFRPDGHWFNKLIKPSFNPPGWLFAPVWTTLYALMGYASYRIWTLRATNEVDSAMMLYGVQLVVNMMFTPAFFGFHKLLLVKYKFFSSYRMRMQIVFQTCHCVFCSVGRNYDAKKLSDCFLFFRPI